MSENTQKYYDEAGKMFSGLEFLNKAGLTTPASYKEARAVLDRIYQEVQNSVIQMEEAED